MVAVPLLLLGATPSASSRAAAHDAGIRLTRPILWVILLGMLLFVAYFLLFAASSSMPLLIGTQVARGVAIAEVGTLGITYMQDLLPSATGQATALFANTFTIGSRGGDIECISAP